MAGRGTISVNQSPQAGNVNPDGSVTEEPELPEGEEMPDLAGILGGS